MFALKMNKPELLLMWMQLRWLLIWILNLNKLILNLKTVQMIISIIHSFVNMLPLIIIAKIINSKTASIIHLIYIYNKC